MIDLFTNPIFYLVFYIVLIIIILLIIKLIFNKHIGKFKEAKLFKYLKKLYKQTDYPYIKEIILPINEDTYVYYDAIVFGDKYIYIIEFKNHDGLLMIDPVDDFTYIDSNLNKNTFTNAFYETEVKKFILNRFLEINKDRIIEVVVIGPKVKVQGEKGNNYLIKLSQVNNFIKKHENHSDIPKFDIDFIESKGNYLLSSNVKKKKIRRKIIDELKNNRYKN